MHISISNLNAKNVILMKNVWAGNRQQIRIKWIRRRRSGKCCTSLIQVCADNMSEAKFVKPASARWRLNHSHNCIALCDFMMQNKCRRFWMRSTNKNELITVRMGNSVAAIVDMKASSEKPKNEASTIYYANGIINPTMVDDTHNSSGDSIVWKGGIAPPLANRFSLHIHSSWSGSRSYFRCVTTGWRRSAMLELCLATKSEKSARANTEFP